MGGAFTLKQVSMSNVKVIEDLIKILVQTVFFSPFGPICLFAQGMCNGLGIDFFYQRLRYMYIRKVLYNAFHPNVL